MYVVHLKVSKACISKPVACGNSNLNTENKIQSNNKIQVLE